MNNNILKFKNEFNNQNNTFTYDGKKYQVILKIVYKLL